MITVVLTLVLGLSPAEFARQTDRSAPDARASSHSHAPREATEGAHQDHNPKHGGTFFMAMHSHHHLEGVLESPGIFRVYLYDSYTRPLASDQLGQVAGTVLVGESEDPPELPLRLSRDGMTLEAVLDRGTKLPVTLTLLLRFPGMARDSRPELFTFPFREYSLGDGSRR